ncbi:MAG TPA: peptide-methionine (S)-S-oxide reductase MsrA [Gemmatimonadales bacterium]|nr:peptide-methionine (S)-S-oxide reductase MsrA [Gemmatimonadales bacterium]
MSARRQELPFGGGGVGAWVGRAALRVSGWRLSGALPPVARFVIIVAPHTSNWDFFVGLAAKFALGLRAKWLGKHSIFRGPPGWILRALGGIPVDRSRPDGTVEAARAALLGAPTMVLALAPEGTRKRTDGWKTGFHRIALAAGVPIVPVAFDWSSRVIALGQPFTPTHDTAADIRHLRSLYHREMARHPALFQDVRDLPAPAPGKEISGDRAMTTELATLGGGCFWCLEAVFEQLRGVERVVSGYAGGTVVNPSYEQVCGGRTGHAEVVQVTFDPAVISYRDLLEVFLTIHDPTTPNRQGADVGPQYRSVILTHSDAQREAAEAAVRAAAALWPQPIVTQIVPLDAFYPAEEGHQGYFRRNGSQRYCQIVIAPKVAAFRQRHLARLRK